MSALDLVADWPVTTAAAAVVSPDGLVATTGPVDHVFKLASVTKPLTATAVLVAVEEEALSLDDPAGDVLPGATVRHLLAHASGIAADEVRRQHAPAERRVYSNAGFDLLGSLVEQATDIAFADYLHEAVFAPLAMTSSSLNGSPAHAGQSTVNDIAQFCLELLRPGGLLSKDALSDLRTVQFAGLRGVLPGFGGQPSNDWGLGFEIRDHKTPHWTGTDNSAATYGHFGQSGTMFWIDPEASLALIALSDQPFGPWAKQAWPELSNAVLADHRQ